MTTPKYPLLDRLLRIILGGLFTVSGCAKLPDLASVEGTIVSVLPMVAGIAPALALSVSVCEILGGLALLAGWEIRKVTALLIVLDTCFVGALLWAIVNGREIVCECFGILPVRLPNRFELIVDIILADMLACVVVVRRMGTFGRVDRVRWRPLRRTTIVTVAVVECAMLFPVVGMPTDEAPLRLAPVLDFVRSRSDPAGPSAAETRVIVFLNFRDFSCAPCFEDFVELCDLVNDRIREADRRQIIGVIREDAIADASHPERLARWLATTGVPFKVISVPDSVYDGIGVRKSSVLVLGENNTPLYVHRLPLGATHRWDVLRHIDPTLRLGGDNGLGN